MLPKKNKLSGYEVILLKKKGKIVHSKTFGLIFSDNDKGITRAGVIVSKKIDKRAVKRNQIRRSIFGILQNLITKMNKDFDILFLVKPQIVNQGKEELEREITKTLSDLKII